MRPHSIQSAVRRLTLLALALVASNAVPVNAQKTRDLDRREERLTALERETERKRDPKEILVEVNEDLSRLNALNEGLSTMAATSTQPLNYKGIVESLSEVKKRATRLKSSLALPKEQNEETSAGFKDAEKAELQLGLTTLNKLLASFLHNPIFSDSGPLDMRLAAKARRDLEDIIVLSEKLRKNAGKTNKPAEKAQ